MSVFAACAARVAYAHLSRATPLLLCPAAASEMGKPQLNDLRSGLATAPVLYAAEEHLEALLPLIQRRFKEVRARRAVHAAMHRHAVHAAVLRVGLPC